MPTYEYRCKDCEHQFEVNQSFSDDPISECPSCGGNVRKLFSAVGISFKGSGFYKTDSRSSSGGASSAASSSGSGSSAGTSSSASSGDSSSSSSSSASSDSGSSSSSTAASA